MPCYTEPHGYCKHDDSKIEGFLCDMETALEKAKIELLTHRQNSNQQIKYYKDKSDEATRLLCKVIEQVESLNLPIQFDQDLKDWWEKHKLFDKQRKKEPE